MPSLLLYSLQLDGDGSLLSRWDVRTPPVEAPPSYQDLLDIKLRVGETDSDDDALIVGARYQLEFVREYG